MCLEAEISSQNANDTAQRLAFVPILIQSMLQIYYLLNKSRQCHFPMLYIPEVTTF